jgi:hypothetical protein
MMVRTQISFDAVDLQEAKQRAAELGVSLAEFVRQAVRSEIALGRPGRNDISSIFGIIGDDDTGEYIPPEKYDEVIGQHLSDEYDRQSADWARREAESER